MIKEDELKLVVTDKTLGTLVTNAESIKSKVKEILPTYKANNYSEDNIEQARKDKALLNNTSKLLNDERIKLEKEFMKPFEDFKSIVKETTDLIKEASSNIDSVVKEVENKEKEKRKAIITEIFEDNVKELKGVLTLEKIFDDKYLNKGSFNDKNEFKLEKELIDKIDKVRQDLITIDNLNSKFVTELKTDYLNSLDLGLVIRKNNELTLKEELLSKLNEESNKVIEEQKEEKMQAMANTVVKEKVLDETLTYTLKITGTTSQLQALKHFMEVNNMTFEKVM